MARLHTTQLALESAVTEMQQFDDVAAQLPKDMELGLGLVDVNR